MRILIFILITGFFLTSCSNEKKQTIEKTPVLVDSLPQKNPSDFNGNWVLTDYINEIEKTKSPVKSSNKLEGVVAIIIGGTVKGDSLEVQASWNNHEELNFFVYLNKNNKKAFKTNIVDYQDKSNYYELGYEVIDKEAFLFLYHFNKTNELLEKTQFSKVTDLSDNKKDVASGLQYMVNDKLLTGKKLLIDTDNHATKLNFNPDGSLTGHPTFKTFHIFTDFMGEPNSNLDLISFNLATGKPTQFAFKIVKDTTFLYSTIENEEEGTSKINKVKFKIVRQ
ncbi:hypothetical protein VB264_01030 [Arcicella aquatica]|uniref:Lipocalin-like protein n=1 Tax=Arcicella aquatica TaxID=217141 RepID=A0ABU5QHR6_9BACT|nr:hypothetical protein [Arcicella aquatica]MEA5256345.1 hypothetical protein [Arcicella aquatica]